MKSAFALLLEEARDRLRRRWRRDVALHFDWDGSAREDSWTAWYDVADEYEVFRGCAGEQALRRLVEALRANAAYTLDPKDPRG